MHQDGIADTAAVTISKFPQSEPMTGNLLVVNQTSPGGDETVTAYGEDNGRRLSFSSRHDSCSTCKLPGLLICNQSVARSFVSACERPTNRTHEKYVVFETPFFITNGYLCEIPDVESYTLTVG